MTVSIDTERVHKLDSRLLLSIIILQPILSLITNYLFTIKFYQPIAVWTNYLINSTLQANLVILFIWVVLIFKIGKHDLSSIWLDKKKSKDGVIAGLIFWFIIQIFVFFYLLLSENTFSFQQNITKEIGLFLGQLFGNALNEELIFRGIFFLQFYILLKKRFSNRTAFIVSIVASQFLFAVIHLPNRILVKHYENLVVDQIRLFIMGILFVLFYVKTGNFALTVIMHSFLNCPLRLFEAKFLYQMVVLAIFLLAILFWNKIKMKFG